MESFSLSILLTKEDYVQSETANGRRIGPLTATGAVLAVAGALLFRFVADLPAVFTGGVAMLGLLLMLCDLVFLPMYARVAAAARFERQDILRQAIAVTFEADAVTVETARLSGRLPRALLTDTTQTPDIFVFTFGAELTLRVPKRLLTAAQAAALEEWRNTAAPH